MISRKFLKWGKNEITTLWLLRCWMISKVLTVTPGMAWKDVSVLKCSKFIFSISKEVYSHSSFCLCKERELHECPRFCHRRIIGQIRLRVWHDMHHLWSNTFEPKELEYLPKRQKNIYFCPKHEIVLKIGSYNQFISFRIICCGSFHFNL